MSHHSPSQRRREARRAYDPNCGPMDICPYKSPFYIEDWLDGWKQGEEEYNKRMEEEEAERRMEEGGSFYDGSSD